MSSNSRKKTLHVSLSRHTSMRGACSFRPTDPLGVLYGILIDTYPHSSTYACTSLPTCMQGSMRVYVFRLVIEREDEERRKVWTDRQARRHTAVLEGGRAWCTTEKSFCHVLLPLLSKEFERKQGDFRFRASSSAVFASLHQSLCFREGHGSDVDVDRHIDT